MPEPGERIFSELSDLPAQIEANIFGLEFRDALEGIWELVRALNRAIDERKPWVLHKNGDTSTLNALLYELCEGLRWLAVLLHPIMPGKSAQMWEQLGMRGEIGAIAYGSLAWGDIPAGTQTEPGDALFPRIELPSVPCAAAWR